MTDRQAMTGTYRLQIRPEFGFTDAAAQVDYLRDLGISHIYLSPILTAAPCSPRLRTRLMSRARSASVSG